MAGLGPRPDWMHPLPEDPPPLAEALTASIEAFRHHEAPSHVCRQCMWEDMERRIVTAARQAQQGICPAPEDFGQIYFEHPACVGGEDTIKLFLPHGLHLMLTGTPPPGFGKHSYPEVIETTLRAGFWFWPPVLLALVRALAARLFRDWFMQGRFDWPSPQFAEDDLLGPGDDILQLCIATLIDPAELIATLAQLHTPQADDALSTPGHFTPETPFYISAETGSDAPLYKPAADAIHASLAAREAQAFLHHVTPEWRQSAFFRNEAAQPAMAARISEMDLYWQTKTVETERAAKAAVLVRWPACPVI